jgi:hypothetical protein
VSAGESEQSENENENEATDAPNNGRPHTQAADEEKPPQDERKAQSKEIRREMVRGALKHDVGASWLNP